MVESDATAPMSDQPATQSSDKSVTPTSNQPATQPSNKSATPTSDQPVTPPSDQSETPPSDQLATPPSNESAVGNEEKKLKYLDFVQVAAIYVVVCCSTIYEYAKENSGPLRPGVQTVEGTVKAVVEPVYEKFHNVPLEILIFVDCKVDTSLIELDHHVPALLKQISRQAFVAAHRAPDVARELASEVQRIGLADMAAKAIKTICAKYEPTTKELYAKYEPIAEQYAVAAWRSLNRLPLFSQVAHIMIPTAGYWAEKYNQAVAFAADRGYTVSYYLPLVPIERITKTFEGAENEPADLANVQYVAVSQ